MNPGHLTQQLRPVDMNERCGCSRVRDFQAHRPCFKLVGAESASWPWHYRPTPLRVLAFEAPDARATVAFMKEKLKGYGLRTTGSKAGGQGASRASVTRFL